MASNIRDTGQARLRTVTAREMARGDESANGGARRVESSFEAGGHCVRVSVTPLGEAERERVAAEMAWFADLLSTPGVDVEATGWMPFLQRLLDDVAITVDDHVVDQLQGIWDQVVWRALRAYIDANRLDPSLKRHLQSGSISPS
jgi:hypothetical protein